jgi:hypothetical protein
MGCVGRLAGAAPSKSLALRAYRHHFPIRAADYGLEMVGPNGKSRPGFLRVHGSIVGTGGAGFVPGDVIQQCFNYVRLDAKPIRHHSRSGPAQIMQAPSWHRLHFVDRCGGLLRSGLACLENATVQTLLGFRPA